MNIRPFPFVSNILHLSFACLGCDMQPQASAFAMRSSALFVVVPA